MALVRYQEIHLITNW